MRGLPPLDERLTDLAVSEWMSGREQAKITGRIARNFNPVLVAGERPLREGWWSIWRDGTGPSGRFSFNSRDDSLMRYWRGPFQQRGLLPASWYDEGKKRWGLPDGSGFWIAAITSTVTEEATGEALLTYSMVTRHGVGEASSVVSSRGESRMPLVLPEDLLGEWLDPERAGDSELVDLIRIGSDEISRAMTTA